MSDSKEPQDQNAEAAGSRPGRLSRLRFSKKKDMPGGLWMKCEGCGTTIYRKELEEKGWLTVRGRVTEEGRQTSNLFKIRRVRNSDVTPQVLGGSPVKNQNPPPSRNRRGTRPKESDPKNSASRKYSTAAETREMLDENQTDNPVDDLGDRVRSARDKLRR